MEPTKFHSENFASEAKKVGDVVIGNETIPVYEINVNPKDLKSILNVLEDGFKGTDWKGKGASELEFFDAVQKLMDEIHKEEPFSLVFIFSDINRFIFWDDNLWDSDNPVKGFLQAWVDGEDGGEWLTWMESPAFADKREKDEAFLTALEKWALAKFLQLVFGDRMLPSPVPHFGSEEERGFGNGTVAVGKLGSFFWSFKNSTETNLPDDDGDFYFWDMPRLTKEELGRLYEFLMGRLKDFYDIYKK